MAYIVSAGALLLCLCYLSLSAAQYSIDGCGAPKNGTCAQDVRALKNLQFAMKQRASPLRGWSSVQYLDPCGRSSCGEGTAHECNFEGLVCLDWRIIKIYLDCPIQSKACSVQQRIDLPEELDQLTALTHLSLANSWMSGMLPMWDEWPSLVYLNLSGNSFIGQLPSSWAGLKNLKILDLSDNQFTGKLPSSWDRLKNLQVLALAENALSGTVPPRWDELNLTTLDLRNNCGLCGALSDFDNQTQVYIDGSNLGSTCHAFNCNSQFFAHIMIIVSLVFGVLALCLLQRHLCMRCRNRRLRDSMAPVLASQQAATHSQDGSGSPPGPTKQSQLAVVVMPDGQTVAFGRKLSNDNLETTPPSTTDFYEIDLKSNDNPHPAASTGPTHSARTYGNIPLQYRRYPSTTTVVLSGNLDTTPYPDASFSSEMPLAPGQYIHDMRHGHTWGADAGRAAAVYTAGNREQANRHQVARQWLRARMRAAGSMLGWVPPHGAQQSRRSVMPTGSPPVAHPVQPHMQVLVPGNQPFPAGAPDGPIPSYVAVGEGNPGSTMQVSMVPLPASNEASTRR